MENHAGLSPLAVAHRHLAMAVMAEGSTLTTLARTVDVIPQIGLREAGPSAIILVQAGKLLLRQMTEVDASTLPCLRDALGATVAAIESEVQVCGGWREPYYVG